MTRKKQKRLPLNNSLINLFAKNLRDINCQKMKHILNFDKAMKNNYEYKLDIASKNRTPSPQNERTKI